MSDPELHDPQLDSAYREMPRDEPSAALDERIRAAALRAVGAGPQSVAAAHQRSIFARWRVPLSLAASILLVVTVTLMVQEEERTPGNERAAPPAPVAVPPPESPRAPPRVPKSAEIKHPSQTSAAGRVAGEESPPVRSLEMRKERAREPASPQVTIPSDAAPAPPTAAPAPPPATAPTAAPSPVLRESGAIQSAPSPRPDQLQQLRGVEASGAAPAGAAPSAASDAAALRSPEDWIAAIRLLKSQGRETEATAELAEFRRRYPDYVLPPDLAR